MTVRVRYRVSITASLDADERQCQFVRPDTTLSEITETHDLSTSGTVELLAGETDHVLPLGDVQEGKILYIEASGDCTVKLDGEATGHRLGAPTTGTKAKLLLRSQFSAAPMITNNDSANAVDIAYFIAGSK